MYGSSGLASIGWEKHSESMASVGTDTLVMEYDGCIEKPRPFIQKPFLYTAFSDTPLSPISETTVSALTSGSVPRTRYLAMRCEYLDRFALHPQLGISISSSSRFAKALNRLHLSSALRSNSQRGMAEPHSFCRLRLNVGLEFRGRGP